MQSVIRANITCFVECKIYNSVLDGGDFCYLLIFFANSLDPNVRPDLDPLIVFLKEFFENVDFEKVNKRQKCMKNYPACKVLQ